MWSPVCFIVAVLISDLVSVCCFLFIILFLSHSVLFLPSLCKTVIFFSLNTICRGPGETYLLTANKGQRISGASLQIYSMSTKGETFALDLIFNITHPQWIPLDSVQDQGPQPIQNCYGRGPFGHIESVCVCVSAVQSFPLLLRAAWGSLSFQGLLGSRCC